MKTNGQSAGGSRGLLAALFVLALALRMVVPAGFMPQAAATPGIVVSICDGTDRGRTTLLTLPLADAGDRQDPSSAQPGPCAFAALSAPALTGAPPPAPTAPAPAPVHRAPPSLTGFGLVAADFLIPPLRGPPARA
ncbi:hypothetical protein ACMT1E_13325 [Sphingomonas flavalba]|uniref:hypothetical protein n=1 Tax=Sphingomonas flavalba TaxID=2559804 RepID=UPI0039E01BA7